MLPSLASDARSTAGTRLQTSAIHIYMYTVHHPRMHRTSSRVLSRSLVGPSSARFLPRSQRARVEQLYSHSSRARRRRRGTGRAHRTHMMPPPLRVGSTEDGSAANVHKKRCNESRSSAEGGRDPLPLLSARQAFLHAHRRYLCFMGAPFRYQSNSCGIVESALSSCSGVDIVLTRCDRPPLKLDHR